MQQPMLFGSSMSMVGIISNSLALHLALPQSKGTSGIDRRARRGSTGAPTQLSKGHSGEVVAQKSAKETKPFDESYR